MLLVQLVSIPAALVVYNLEVARVDDAVAISVPNRPEGRLPPPREQWRPAPDVSLNNLSPRGRGLAIVESLSEEVRIEYHGDEVVVTALLRMAVARS